MEMVGGCCVCLDERGWDENPLVYCDGSGCNVAVHQACYGIVKVPSGPWFCCKCQSTERVARVKCELCPFKEGALKRTDNGGWAHVVCALYIPEVRFGNVTTMEPIKMSSVPHERFLKTCYLCEESGRESKTSNGACMTCNKPGCKLTFHVTCAQAKRMLCEEAGHYGNVQYVGYCSQHWGKKFGSRNNAAVEQDRKAKEKKRARQDSVSSADGSVPKQKKKEKNTSTAPSKTNSNSCSPVDADVIGDKGLDIPISGLARAGSAEKSAAESLNMLQQMTSAKDYFVNSNDSKTPLNSLISPDVSIGSSSSQFDMANILNKQKGKNFKKQGNDEFVDIETFTSSDVVHRENEKKLDMPKIDNKPKASSMNSEKTTTSQTKKSGYSQSKSSLHGKQMGADSKKRKSLSGDSAKALKRKKVDERKKAKNKIDRQKSTALPRPSKTNMFEDNRIPSLFPRNLGEKNPESFQDLLEFQWNQGAQFLIQKAAHYDVGSLLSCLYQLRAENDDLEKRLEQLSARRDRLLAATSRLSTPLTGSTDAERPVPLSNMLAKLKNDPGESKSSEKKRLHPKVKDSPQEFQTCSPLPSRPPSSNSRKDVMSNGANQGNGHNGIKDLSSYSDTSFDDLDCKEVLSEDTPPRELKISTQIKKETKKKNEITESDRNHNNIKSHLQSPLVQPPIVNPSDPHIVGSITAGHCPTNPADYFSQLMRQPQNGSSYTAQGYRPPSSVMDFTNGKIASFRVDGRVVQNHNPKSKTTKQI